MSASAILIHSVGRLGSTIRFSDGTTRPPSRFTRKVKDWEGRNGTGRLISVNDPYRIGSPGTFSLHIYDLTGEAVVMVRVNVCFTTDSPLTFEVIAEPKPGSALVLTQFAGRAELQHVAADQASAEAWLARNRFYDARIEVVPDATCDAAAA